MTFQKLHLMLKKDPIGTRRMLARFDALIVDETHSVSAATFFAVCEACPAYYRFGLSATPFERSDNKSAPLLSMFGGLVYRKTEGELSKEINPVTGYPYLPVAVIKMVRFEQAPVFLGKWDLAYKMQVVRNPARNDLVAAMAASAKKPCLVLFSALDHGNLLKNRLDDMGFRVEKVDAKASTSQRLDVIKRLNSGDIDIVVASRVFNVGVDVPELRSVVIAAAMQSAVQTIQRVGRGMRLTKTKRSFEVWDVLDWGENFTKARGAWVAKHAHQRLKTYRKRGHDVFTGDTTRGPWAKLPGAVSKPRVVKGKAQAQAQEVGP
jgi:superfamily II DNA or RNA helicase